MFLRHYILITLFIYLVVNPIAAQQRFKGGVVAGFNAAQIDGDLAAGYHKLGLNIGLRSIIELGGRLEIMTELLYGQRGSRTTESESPINRVVTLNYLEVPVLLNIRDWLKEDGSGKTYHKAHFSAGLVYGRLFRASANQAFFHAAVLDKFATNDVSYMAGIGYYVNRHWGFTGRIAKSFGYLFNPEKYANEPLAGGLAALRGHYVSFQTVWIF
jgi:hypothetical protein